MAEPTVAPPQPDAGEPIRPRDEAYWSQPVQSLSVSGVPAGALNLNVEGRRVVGPLQGFGPLWQKTYRVRLDDGAVTPADVIRTWKQRFPEFWPQGNRFYAPLCGIAPGEVAVLNLAMPGHIPLSTGVLVLYADDESFTLMTPQGHMFSGWITFSAYEEEGATVAQAQVLMRSNDPLYELGLRLGGHRQEDEFWRRTLTALAAHLGGGGPAETRVTRVDPRVQWSRAGNIRYNAAVRTAAYVMASPFRRARGLLRR